MLHECTGLAFAPSPSHLLHLYRQQQIPPSLLHRYPQASFDLPPTRLRPHPTMADKLRAQQQLEALQARYIGIGSADTSKHEWTSNMARDSLASYVGHPPLLQYMSIGMGQPREKTRVQLLERMIQPVGPPPKVRRELKERNMTIC